MIAWQVGFGLPGRSAPATGAVRSAGEVVSIGALFPSVSLVQSRAKVNRLRSVKGMNDALPREAAALFAVELQARQTFARYGFGEVRTPVVEEAALFQRGIGDTTDVVEKEMYVFPDRHDTLLALRPEGTASAVRAYLQHNPAAEDPITRWFYAGAMFRHERPQKGRYRQFHQVGAELFGAAGPEADVELLAMVHDWLRALGILGISLQLNSIGDTSCRPAYLSTLQTFLRAHEVELCDDCRRRAEKNPLRVLDCKNPNCQLALKDSPVPSDHLCEPCRVHFAAVCQALTALELPYVHNPRLVRGLDYYTRTTFEFVAEVGSGVGGGLGSQNTVAAGGRYDGLVEALGGAPTPAVGFAAGIERLVLARQLPVDAAPASPDLFVASHSEGERLAALKLAAAGRAAGLWAEIDLRGGSLKSQLRRADRLGAKVLVVLGAEEIASGNVKLKQMGAAGSLGAGQTVAASLAEVAPAVWRVLRGRE